MKKKMLTKFARNTHLPVVAEGEDELLSAPNPDTGDGRVVVGSEKANRGETALLQLLESLEHSGDEITAHERECKLRGELVLSVPDGPSLLVEVLPEMGDSLGESILV